MKPVIRRNKQASKLLKDEIGQNRLAGLKFIRDMHEVSEATVGIETRMRSVPCLI